MQKLTTKLKNVPRNASLVPCSTRYMLNRVQRLSAYNKVLIVNNLEVNLPTSNSRQGLRVPVTVMIGKLVLKSSSYKNSSNFKLDLV